MSWAGNANDTVILDSLNQKFAVSKSDRSLVYGADEITLTGAKVDSSGNLTYNGKVIGAVTGVTSTSGNKIASFTCTDSSRMTISIRSGAWAYSCAGVASATTTTTTSGSTGSSSSSGTSTSGSSGGSTVEVATQCISVVRAQGKWADMTNTCAYDIEVSWCYIGGDCKNGTWGGSNLGTIRAGNTRSASTFASNSNQYVLSYFACKGANTSPSEVAENQYICKP